MPWLALGSLGLFVMLGLGMAVARMDPGRLTRVLMLTAALGSSLVAAGLLALGRVGLGLWVGGASLWLWSVLVASSRGGGGSAGGSAGGARARARARTMWLAMRFDKDTGEISGEVLRDPWRGRSLASLSPEELDGLRARLGAEDPASLRLLEAWMVRAGKARRGGAGGGAGRGGAGGSAGRGGMSRDEALETLGLDTASATPAAVRAAHRRLIRKLHSDVGGSDWLAARVNEAREILLKGGR